MVYKYNVLVTAATEAQLNELFKSLEGKKNRFGTKNRVGIYAEIFEDGNVVEIFFLGQVRGSQAQTKGAQQFEAHALIDIDASGAAKLDMIREKDEREEKNLQEASGLLISQLSQEAAKMFHAREMGKIVIARAGLAGASAAMAQMVEELPEKLKDVDPRALDALNEQERALQGHFNELRRQIMCALPAGAIERNREEETERQRRRRAANFALAASSTVVGVSAQAAAASSQTLLGNNKRSGEGDGSAAKRSCPPTSSPT